MKERVNEFAAKYIAQNAGVFFITILFFALGIATGAFTVKAQSHMQQQNLLSYLNGFFQIISTSSATGKELLWWSLKNNFLTVFFIWICGMTIIGIPFNMLIVSFRGFILGFSVSFLLSGMGWKGLLFVIIAILPQNALYISCLIAISVLSLSFSLRVFKKKGALMGGTEAGSIVAYSIKTLMIMAIMLIGCIIEAFISPAIIRLISSYMLK